MQSFVLQPHTGIFVPVALQTPDRHLTDAAFGRLLDSSSLAYHVSFIATEVSILVATASRGTTL